MKSKDLSIILSVMNKNCQSEVMAQLSRLDSNDPRWPKILLILTNNTRRVDAWAIVASLIGLLSLSIGYILPK
jgi:uncharacterized membrane protein SpoIIM required for sporulation